MSVGEVQAARPLVEALLQRYPRRTIMVTTTTPTGSAHVKRLFRGKVQHCYLPFDLPGATGRFLESVRPRLALIMETELWPNLFHGCAKRGIPLVVANARLSPRSLTGYRRILPLVRDTLRNVWLIAAQGEGDAERFRMLGGSPEQLRVTGSMKFDQSLPGDIPEKGSRLRRRLGGSRPVWIAASTHQGEEELVLKAFRLILQEHRDCLLVLVPRHPERFEQVAEFCQKEGFTLARRTDDSRYGQDTKVFLGDTMGELLLFYAAADVAFIGGSFVPVGGHNMLEPAILGKPVITGPHLFNFADIAAAMEEAGALRRVDDCFQLAEAVSGLLSSPEQRGEIGDRGRRLIEENRGALDRLLDLLAPILR